MPNLAAVYTRLTKNPILDDPNLVPVNDNEDYKRLLQNWKQSTVTKEIVADHERVMVKLLEEAMQLACSYPSHQNPHRIIQNLVKAQHLYEFINTYGTNQ